MGEEEEGGLLGENLLNQLLISVLFVIHPFVVTSTFSLVGKNWVFLLRRKFPLDQMEGNCVERRKSRPSLHLQYPSVSQLQYP